MLKIFKGLLAAVFAVGLAACSTTTEVDRTENLRQIEIATVALKGACSGTFIEDPIKDDGIQPTIISAKHCTRGFGKNGYGQVFEIQQDAYPNTAGAYDFSTSMKFKVVAISSESDLILLQPEGDYIPDNRVTPIKIWEGTPKFGQTVIGVSYPALTGKLLEDCRLSYVEKEEAFGMVSQSSYFQKTGCDALGGSSGSGLFATNEVTGKYELMGVLTGGMAGIFTWYTPLMEVRKFLDEAPILHAQAKLGFPVATEVGNKELQEGIKNKPELLPFNEMMKETLFR